MKACLTLLLLLLATSGFAQLQLLPLEEAPATHAAARKTAAVAQRQAVLDTLPIWDDFSYQGYVPDTLIWSKRSTASLSHGLAILPPSYGVVTFDGVDNMGNPYSSSNTIGLTDSLITVPLDLSGLIPAAQTSTYLSFFWQLQGRGERPDIRDALYLEFLDAEGQWHQVWYRNGSSEIDATRFQQEIISLQEEGSSRGVNFFHPDFRFRFQSQSRQSGHFDQWHLDHVYLNKGRSATDIYYVDKALSTAFPSLLQTYTAMPLHQFLKDPSDYLRPDLPFTAFNFDSPTKTEAVLYMVEVKNSEGELVYKLPSKVALINPVTEEDLRGQSIHQENALAPSASAFDAFSSYDSLYLTTTIFLESEEPQAYRYRNDTITVQNVLHNYYAYDDGTAEAAASLRTRGQRMAYRFKLQESDTLTDIAFYFPYYNQSSAGRGLDVHIYTQLAGVDGALTDEKIHTQAITVPEQAGLNQFSIFPLSVPKVLEAGTFYVGIEQVGTNSIPIGLDLNTNTKDSVYQSTDGIGWYQNFNQEASIMLRPYFRSGVDETVLGFDDQLFPEVSIYPNPTRNKLVVASEAQQLRLYDIQGRIMLQQEAGLQTELSLGHLRPGLYMLQLVYKKGIQSKRIVIIP